MKVTLGVLIGVIATLVLPGMAEIRSRVCLLRGLDAQIYSNGGVTCVGFPSSGDPGKITWFNNEPRQNMTLLIWKMADGASSVDLIHGGALSQEKAMEWKVWQPSSAKLEHRIIFDGPRLGEASIAKDAP